MTHHTAAIEVVGIAKSYDDHPVLRLQELLAERGWSGWSRIDRTAEHSADVG